MIRILVSTETDDTVGRRLLAELDGAQVLPYDPNQTELDEQQRTANVLVPPYRSSGRPIPLLAQLPDLRMVQLLSAGADEYAGDVPAAVTLASARGAHAGPVSEWVLSAILTLYRQWPALVRYQDQAVWAHRRVDAETLAGQHVLIYGAGSIGLAAADKLAVFGARTTLVASHARGNVHGADEVPALLPDHQIVVITAPLTEDTRGAVDAKFLAALPDDALVINAGRGAIIDTDALLTELQTRRLRAALDVTDPEPLPSEHPLWTCDGVIISPHMARTVPGTNELCYRVAAEQISTLLRGEIPSNTVTSRR